MINNQGNDKMVSKSNESSKILEETIMEVKKNLGNKIQDIKIERAVIGLFFTGVCLNTGHAGICATPIKEIPEAVCCPSSARAMPNAGHLTERSVKKYLNDTLSSIPMRRTMGIAVLSALSSFCWEEGLVDGYNRKVDVDATECLHLRDDSYYVLIGAIVPVLRILKRRKMDFSVIELDPRTLKEDEMPFYVPVEKTADTVPKADVLIVTGTTLINGTLESILKLARPDTQVVILGPTASIIPHAFFRRGVNVLGGDIITNPEKMLDILAEGGSGYHLYGKSVDKVVVTVKHDLK